jgi:hypothetical protein
VVILLAAGTVIAHDLPGARAGAQRAARAGQRRTATEGVRRGRLTVERRVRILRHRYNLLVRIERARDRRLLRELRRVRHATLVRWSR